MTILANVWGFWIDMKCYNAANVTTLTLACTTKDKELHGVNDGDGESSFCFHKSRKVE
jgi:hypothetical protein